MGHHLRHDSCRGSGSRRGHVTHNSALPGLDAALCVHHGRRIRDAEIYQGNLFSQQRVVSYTQLLTGETLAQRTIDKLGLDMSAEALQNVKASAKLDTVLIDVDGP